MASPISIITSGCDNDVCLELPLLFKLHRFGQLILRKIIEIVASRMSILWLKCTKFDFGWGSASDSTGELTTLPSSDPFP